MQIASNISRRLLLPQILLSRYCNATVKLDYQFYIRATHTKHIHIYIYTIACNIGITFVAPSFSCQLFKCTFYFKYYRIYFLLSIFLPTSIYRCLHVSKDASLILPRFECIIKLKMKDGWRIKAIPKCQASAMATSRRLKGFVVNVCRCASSTTGPAGRISRPLLLFVVAPRIARYTPAHSFRPALFAYTAATYYAVNR